MNKRIKYIMITIAGIGMAVVSGISAVALIAFICNRNLPEKEAAEMAYQADGEFMLTCGIEKLSGGVTAVSLEEMLDKIWRPIEEMEQAFQNAPYSYYIRLESVWAGTITEYGISPKMEHLRYPWVGVPDDTEKEKRVNALIMKQCDKVLPKMQEWIENARLQLLYYSERYLCFRYMENAFLPEDYDITQLYFTIDMEEEKILDYPGIEDMDWVYGNLYEEQEAYEAMSIEEQNAMRGDAGYDLYEKEESYLGISFSYIQVRNLQDAKIQGDINAALREPLITLIETNADRPHYFAAMKMYVACKTPQWLSVVYTFETGEWSKLYDGYSDIGVTVNVETGERYMLDDLVDMDEFLLLICINSGVSIPDWLWKSRLLGSLKTEKELSDYYKYKERREGESYDWNCSLYRYGFELYPFYLSPGKLVIMKEYSFADIEIPLPEIYQCLLVDPWYE